MSVQTTKIEKRKFDSREVLMRLKRESTRSKDVEEVIRVYEEGMTRMTRQLKDVLTYGANEPDAIYPISLSETNAINNNNNNNNNPQQLNIGRSQSLTVDALQNSANPNSMSGGGIYLPSGDPTMSPINSDQERKSHGTGNSSSSQQKQQSLQKWKAKAQELEGQWNMEREQRERAEAQLEQVKSELEVMRTQLKLTLDQNQKQIQSLTEKDDQLASALKDLKHFQDVETKHIETIQQLQDQLQKKIAQMTEIEDDRNQLIERYLLEKSEFALKMNELNNMQDELNQKMGRLAEDEEYLIKRKLNFNTEIKQSGVKMPQLAPTIEDSKISMEAPSGVPSKAQKALLKLHKNEIYSIAQTLNGSMIATCGGDNNIKFYDPLTMTSHGSITSTREDTLFLSTMFAPFNELMVAGLTDKTVQLYSYQTCKLRATFQGHNDRVNVVSFSSEKDKVISGSADRSLKIWDINKGSTSKAIVCGSVVRSIDYFQSEPHIITGHNDGSVRLYSTRDSGNTKPVINLQGIFDGGITCVKLSNCHNYVLVSSADGFALKAIDLRKSKVVKVFENSAYFNNHEFNKCCFGPDDKYVIAGCSDSTTFIWDFVSGQKKSILKTPNHQGVIVAVDFHNITGNLYTGDSRGNLVIWN